MAHLTYLGLLAGCLVVTAPLELVLRVRVYARWRRLLLALLPGFVVFVAWVLYAIAQDHWATAATASWASACPAVSRWRRCCSSSSSRSARSSRSRRCGG